MNTAWPSLWMVLILAASGVPGTLDQVRADSNPEHRAKAAVEFAAVAERDAETAYGKGDMDGVRSDLRTMQDAMELAKKSFEEWGKSANHHAGPYKFAETRSHDLLLRLNDLENRMDESERPLVEGPKGRVQEIHDAWFDAIMERKK
jgi:hypothetical protein